MFKIINQFRYFKNEWKILLTVDYYFNRFCGPRVHDPQVRKQLQWGINCVDQYKKLNIAGEGTFGQVYKAKHIKTGIICALKKVCSC